MVPAKNDLPSWQYVRRVIANSTESSRRSLQGGLVTSVESSISLNMALLVERMPKLQTLRSEISLYSVSTFSTNLSIVGGR